MDLSPIARLVRDGAYFLVGAGASRHVSANVHCPHDFPLGADLLHEFREEVVNSAYPVLGLLPEEQRAWVQDLGNHFTSIDDLLHRAHSLAYCELVDCGRTFVDRRIYQSEAKAFAKHGYFVVPWVKQLLDFVSHGADCYESLRDHSKPQYDNSNEITFHTLNYDRVIEFSMMNYLCARYPCSVPLEVGQAFVLFRLLCCIVFDGIG